MRNSLACLGTRSCHPTTFAWMGIGIITTFHSYLSVSASLLANHACHLYPSTIGLAYVVFAWVLSESCIREWLEGRKSRHIDLLDMIRYTAYAKRRARTIHVSSIA